MEPFAAPELAILGALLVACALVGVSQAHGMLSFAALAVLVGIASGPAGLGVLSVTGEGEFITALVTGALIVILFRDGLDVDAELLRDPTAWRMPLRKVVLATLITGGVIAGAAHWLLGLPWSQALLLGAVLSPTDPVLASRVVTDTRVPPRVRHSLNLESGLNDGLALPLVLVMLTVLGAGSSLPWWQFIAQDVCFGVLTGVAVGYLAAAVMPRTTGQVAHKSLYGLGCALACYSVTVSVTHGNGLIATFVCALVLGMRRPDIRTAVVERADDILDIVKLSVFVCFGALLTSEMLFADRWAAVAVAVVALGVARPLAVFAALAGIKHIDQPTKLFMAWFGPRGVASVAFALLVLEADLPSSERLFGVAALVVFCSVLAHGLTAGAGVRWIDRHADGRQDDQQPRFWALQNREN